MTHGTIDGYDLLAVERYTLRGDLQPQCPGHVQQAGTTGASSSESDKYEELIVNPAILTLVKQRGNIDCGGAEFVLIRYGNFFQFLLPIEGGHISVCIEPYADPLELLAPIRAALSQADLQLPGENA